MRLARAEWSRLFGRRFTKIMILVALLILGAVAAGVAFTSYRHDAAELAAAHTQADRVRDEARVSRARCEAQQGSQQGGQQGGPDEFPPGFDCSRIDASQVRDEDFMRHEYDFRMETPVLLKVFGGILALLGFAVGASFVGAEWTSGGMTNLLLWRPRRIPVLLTKLGTLLAGITAITVGLAGAYAGMLYAVARTRGTLGHVTQGSMISLGLDGLRGLAVGLAAAVIGFAVASLGRHTAIALGLALGWGLLGEAGLRIVLSIAHVQRPERYFLSTYVAAWLNKGLRFEDVTKCEFTFGPGPCKPDVWKITMGQSAILTGVIVVVLLGLAIVSIRRRDVT